MSILRLPKEELLKRLPKEELLKKHCVVLSATFVGGAANDVVTSGV